MSLSRGTLVTLAEEMADAVGSPRWGTTLKRQLLGEAHWREWRDLLNVNRMLRVGTRTATLDANGRFAKAALTSGSGDSTQTFYRVLSLQSGGTFYQQARYEDYPVAPANVVLPRVWYELGDEVQVLPTAEGNSVTVLVNHLPQRADLLVDDNSTVTFPDGYDLILAYELAASMLMKGAAETQLAAELRGMAQVLRDRLQQDVARMGTKPLRLAYADDRADWGAVS